MDRWVRSLRSEKTPHSPCEPPRVTLEQERLPGGGVSAAATVFLVGQECPFSCVFCDLWRHTLDIPTPVGAIVRQLELALCDIPHRDRIKLYNASNFFDPAAVPVEDEARILELLHDFERVTVECHPRFIGRRCFDFAAALSGELEVAIGLESVHPRVLPRLNKKMTLADFEHAAGRLSAQGIGVRAFVLLGVPYLRAYRQVEWCVRSVRQGLRFAQLVSIIPVRGGGALETLEQRGEWQPVSLPEVESAFEQSLRQEGTVQLDLWDLDRLALCEGCADERLARLAVMNLSGRIEPPVDCAVCCEPADEQRSASGS